jgi:hypothetical protein
MARLPFAGVRGGFRENHPWVQWIGVVCSLDADPPIFQLAFSGQPFWAQRECIGAVERALQPPSR